MPIGFSSLTESELSMLYHGLCELVSARTGRKYFHNGDRGHPDYIAGAKGMDDLLRKTGADSPNDNPLYRLGSDLFRECIRRTPRFFEDRMDQYPTDIYSSWENFCEAARRAHDAGADR